MKLGESVPVKRERCDCFVASRHQNPVPQIVLFPNLQGGIDDLLFIQKVGDTNDLRYIFRITADRMLVFQDVDGNTARPEAPRDSESSMIPTDDKCTHIGPAGRDIDLFTGTVEELTRSGHERRTVRSELSGEGLEPRSLLAVTNRISGPKEAGCAWHPMIQYGLPFDIPSMRCMTCA